VTPIDLDPLLRILSAFGLLGLAVLAGLTTWAALARAGDDGRRRRCGADLTRLLTTTSTTGGTADEHRDIDRPRRRHCHPSE
jgi:hypothetical protein